MSGQDNNHIANDKATAFFDRAQKAAATNSFDYAIDMYLEGLRLKPDLLQEHFKLYQLAQLRKEKGGKKPTMVERVKRLKGKTPLDQMINAEYLFSKDPGRLAFAETMLKGAAAGGYKGTAKWIADMIFQANNASKKPSIQTYLLLKDSYAAIEQYDRALAACQHAVKLKPQDGDLADEFKRLSAELTVARGRYDQEGDFRNSIKNKEEQERQYSQQRVVKTEDYRITAVKNARKLYADDPNLPKSIFHLAEALSELENDHGENEAIELLTKTYEAKDDFSYKKRANEIRIKQIKRKIRKVKKILDKRGEDAEANSQEQQLLQELQKVGLEHYRLCVENYPTDLEVKYEYAVRLLRDKRYDDAIPLFQESQRDPRRKIPAMSKIGMCFFKKGWFTDAVDLFTQAIDSYDIQDDGTAKELRYNLARAYEEQNELDKSLEIYRKIAQLDFGYRDVRQRVDKLRNNGT